jgi:flagellar basal-body rod protein FlgB
MAPMIVRDETLDALGSYLSRLTRRQEVVASNIANVDTPGYRTKDISFHATMSELVADRSSEVRGLRDRHFSVPPSLALIPEPLEVEGLTERADRNNVDIDREMLKLSQTSAGYSVAIQLLRAKFRTIAASIQEGRTG